MKRVLAVLVALLWWCPTAFPQELANLRIAVDAEPGTPRTEALVALLRTRFTRVDVGDPAEADVVVLDRWEGVGERRPDRHWRRDWARPYKPHVVLGGAARGAIPAWNLLGARAGEPVEGPTERRDPGSTRPGPELSAPLFADGYAPLAFALLEAPDAHVALATRDGIGRPLALVWHQGGFVFFGPGAAADELGAEWKDVLLRCVAYAGGFHRSYGSVLSPGASGADAHGELAWRLSGESPQLVGLAALVSDPAAPSSDGAEEWRAWFERHGPYLVRDAEGRLRSDAGLVAFGADPSSPGFVAGVVARLSAESAEERATARRLLERHVEDGPGVYASRAEWEGWLEDPQRFLMHFASDQRWRRLWKEGDVSPLNAWDHAAALRGGGHSFHAVDPRLAARVPGSGGEPSLLRVPYIWNLPPEMACDVLLQWLRETETVPDRELVLRNMAEIGPDASRIAGAVAEWFDGGSALLVVRVLALGGPAIFEPFVKAAKLAEEVARAGRPPPVELDPAVAAKLGSERVRAMHRLPIDLDVAVDVLMRHPLADGPFHGRVAAAAGALPDGHWSELREALLGGLARSGAPVDPSWNEPLELLVARHGPLHTPNLIRALAQHGDDRWVDEFRQRFAALEKQTLELPAPAVAAVAGMGAGGLELFLESARKGTPAWRSRVASLVDLTALAHQRPPRDWLASESSIEVVAQALVLQDGAHREWHDALSHAATVDDDRTAVLALEAASRVLSLERSWPLLQGALLHTSTWRRRAAIHAIATFHVGREYVRDALLAATHDEDPWVQVAALWALRQPLGDRDAAVLDRLGEVAASPSEFAPVARHSLFRRTVSDAPLLDAVHALEEPMATVPSDRLDSKLSAERIAAALWAGRQGESDGERRRRIEHELLGWIDALWDPYIVLMDGATLELAQIASRLGEASLLAAERLRPFVWSGSAFAFEVHGEIARVMGTDGWPLLAGLIWGSDVPLDAPLLAWPSLPGAHRWLAMMVAQRESHVLSVGRLGVVVAGVDFDVSLARWRILGEPGRAALVELEQHPSAAVREHARAVLARLGE